MRDLPLRGGNAHCMSVQCLSITWKQEVLESLKFAARLPFSHEGQDTRPVDLSGFINHCWLCPLLLILLLLLLLLLPFYVPLSGTTRVSRYQKKHSPTHTYTNHQSSFICFPHLIWSRLLLYFHFCPTELHLLLFSFLVPFNLFPFFLLTFPFPCPVPSSCIYLFGFDWFIKTLLQPRAE